MIPQFGWRSVLVLGGVAPLVLTAAGATVLLLLLLPESVRYMVAKGQPMERVRAVLRRISPPAAEADSFTTTETASAATAKSGVGLVLSRPYLVGSIGLWVAMPFGLPPPSHIQPSCVHTRAGDGLAPEALEGEAEAPREVSSTLVVTLYTSAPTMIQGRQGCRNKPSR